MKIEYKIVFSVLVLLSFITAHLLYPILSLWDHVFFMGFSIGNMIVDFLFFSGIVMQIYLIIIIIRDVENGNSK